MAEENEKTFTQADIDGLTQRHQEELANLKARLKEEYDRKADGLSKKIKAEIEEKTKLENMSELEKLQVANKDLSSKLQEKEDIILLTNQKDEIRAYMKEKGVDVNCLDFCFIPKDVENTKKRVDAFKEYTENIKKTTFENSVKSTIPNNGGNLSEEAALRQAFGLK